MCIRDRVHNVRHVMVFHHSLPQVERLCLAMRERMPSFLNILSNPFLSCRASGCNAQDARFSLIIHPWKLAEAAHWDASVRRRCSGYLPTGIELGALDDLDRSLPRVCQRADRNFPVVVCEANLSSCHAGILILLGQGIHEPTFIYNVRAIGCEPVFVPLHHPSGGFTPPVQKNNDVFLSTFL